MNRRRCRHAGPVVRFEPLHLALAPSHDLMRVFGTVVHPQPLLMAAGQPQSVERRGVGAQLVRGRHAGARSPACGAACASASSAARLFRRGWTRRSRISPSWSTARHRYSRFPAIRTTISSRCQRSPGRGRPLPQPARNERAEFQHPAPDCFVREVEPTFGKELLNVAVAQGEAHIEPNRVVNIGAGSGVRD